MIKKSKEAKENGDLKTIIETTRSRINQNSMLEFSKTSLLSLDFNERPNFLVSARHDFLSSKKLYVPHSLKIKETREERALDNYKKYEELWCDHQ